MTLALLVQAIPASTNPLVIASYIAGFLLALPFLYALVKLVFFFANVTTTLKNVVEGLESVTSEMKQFREGKNDDRQSVEMSFLVIETDVNALQRKNGLPESKYPDRRVGPTDRRHAT